jgi:hypothetical protein
MVIKCLEVLNSYSRDFRHFFSLGYVNQSEFKIVLIFSKVPGFFGQTNIEHTKNNPKVELHTQFWRQVSPKKWDFPSKNDSSDHFSVDSLGKCETRLLPFFVAVDVCLT